MSGGPGLARALGIVGSLVVRLRYARHLARPADDAGPTLCTDDAVQLRLEIDDSPNAPLTVVFVHGFAGCAEAFDAQWAALRDRVRLVRYDQRGHGRSGWRGRRWISIDRLGKDLGEVIDRLTGDRPVVVVAHSMGGMALLSLAGQRPELFGSKVVGVTLLSTLAAPLTETGLLPVSARPGLLRPVASGLAWLLWWVAPLVDAVAPFPRKWGRRWLRHRAFGAGRAPGEAVRAVEEMWAHMPQSIAGAFYPGFVTYQRAESLEVLRRVPTAVIAGTADTTIPSRLSEEMVERIGPGAELVLVPGAGHVVQMTHPEQVNRALLDLLRRAVTGPRPAAPAASRTRAADLYLDLRAVRTGVGSPPG